MELKQKFIIWQSVIGATLVLGFVGYFAFYFFTGILQLPPKNTENAENLFIAKTEIDIANIRHTKNFSVCTEKYNTVCYSLLEDKINGFLDKNAKENEKQCNRLYKKSVFTYTEQFIILANQYFEQSEWNENDYVKTITRYIKNTGFVEYNTPNWNILSGFENAISCYTEMLNCRNRINAINDIPSYDTFLAIRNQKNDLLNKNCKKNSDALNSLNSSYENLNGRLPNLLQERIKQYNSDFVDAYDSASYDYQKADATEKAMQQYAEMAKWKNIYNTLNEVLDNFYQNIYE
jgi:hypothetical protein